MKTKTISSKDSTPAPKARVLEFPRKLGANRNETAKRPRKHHDNFKQSTDLREDRGIRQLKTSPKNRPQKGR